MADVRDVMGRIASHLTRQETEHRLACDEAVIVVAAEILPSQALAFDRAHTFSASAKSGASGGDTGVAGSLAIHIGFGEAHAWMRAQLLQYELAPVAVSSRQRCE